MVRDGPCKVWAKKAFRHWKTKTALRHILNPQIKSPWAKPKKHGRKGQYFQHSFHRLDEAVSVLRSGCLLSPETQQPHRFCRTVVQTFPFCLFPVQECLPLPCSRRLWESVWTRQHITLAWKRILTQLTLQWRIRDVLKWGDIGMADRA